MEVGSDLSREAVIHVTLVCMYCVLYIIGTSYQVKSPIPSIEVPNCESVRV